jgi:hypothetical protein
MYRYVISGCIFEAWTIVIQIQQSLRTISTRRFHPWLLQQSNRIVVYEDRRRIRHRTCLQGQSQLLDRQFLRSVLSDNEAVRVRVWTEQGSWLSIESTSQKTSISPMPTKWNAESTYVYFPSPAYASFNQGPRLKPPLPPSRQCSIVLDCLRTESLAPWTSFALSLFSGCAISSRSISSPYLPESSMVALVMVFSSKDALDPSDGRLHAGNAYTFVWFPWRRASNQSV